ncbi:hypothetical protein SK128_018730 [Halocaridina rubra]|uniref:Uncharacterized protein n=1 Tax=Halocaridina rubra TaxID=373956 RepID=A0AAN8WW49_HALRR
MLLDTRDNVTVFSIHHLELLRIPRSNLKSLPATTTFTADGFQMSPALGWFQATLRLGSKFCMAKIHVCEGTQTSLLSIGHCQELAIISPDVPKPILTITHVNKKLAKVLVNIGCSTTVVHSRYMAQCEGDAHIDAFDGGQIRCRGESWLKLSVRGIYLTVRAEMSDNLVDGALGVDVIDQLGGVTINCGRVCFGSTGVVLVSQEIDQNAVRDRECAKVVIQDSDFYAMLDGQK